jgi:hypothetical protein
MSILIVTTDLIGFSFWGIFRHIQYGKLPVIVHVHAAIFVVWMLLYLAQSILATNERISLHRTLGWFSTGMVAAILASGFLVTFSSIRRHTVPPFFGMGEFLLLNSLQLFAFAGLVISAIVLRRKVEWHRRLMVSAAAVMTEPAFGRLLPMPLLGSAMLWVLGAAGMLFIIAGMGNDLLLRGRVHRAWLVGLAAHFLAIALIHPLAGTQFIQNLVK